MRLYMLEKINSYENIYFYWAENEGDALDKHEKMTGESEDWVASAVFADNMEKAYRGYVVDNN